jgi:predicted nucleotide-binding protein
MAHGSDGANTKNRNKVLVVHGRNRPARNAMFSSLRSLGLQPIEWSQAVTATGKATPYIGEVLNAAFSMAQAVVVLMTPDDEVRLRPEFRSQNDADYESNLTGQARPNALFEAGMAMGRDESRTVLVELGMLRPFSDIGGMHVIRIDNSSQRRQELARRLERAGCSVDLTGTDWHTEGDFEASVPGPKSPPPKPDFDPWPNAGPWHPRHLGKAYFERIAHDMTSCGIGPIRRLWMGKTGTPYAQVASPRPNWMVETADGKRWTSRARCTTQTSLTVGTCTNGGSRICSCTSASNSDTGLRRADS